MMNDKADKIIEELFQSLLSRYQIGLETLMWGSNFFFDCVHLLYYKCHEINFKGGGLYINFSDWIKNKTTIISVNKKDNKCFQYTVTVVLNHEQIKSDPQTKIKAFIDKYNRKGINYPSEKDDRQKTREK